MEGQAQLEIRYYADQYLRFIFYFIVADYKHI